MLSTLLDHAPQGAYAILLGLLLRFLYVRIRPWIKTRKEMAQDKAKVRRQTAKYFSAFVLACAVVFALLLLLAVALPQTSPRTPIVLLLAGAAGGLGVVGALLMVFGLPTYNDVVDLNERWQNLEDRCLRLDRRNQFLETRCRSLEDRCQKLEERLATIELQGQGQNGLEKQIPQQRNFAFMEIWPVHKWDHDAAKSDVGRRAGSQR